jgi:hypothetical protein
MFYKISEKKVLGILLAAQSRSWLFSFMIIEYEDSAPLMWNLAIGHDPESEIADNDVWRRDYSSGILERFYEVNIGGNKIEIKEWELNRI